MAQLAARSWSRRGTRGVACVAVWALCVVGSAAACAMPRLGPGEVTGTVDTGEQLRVGECVEETPQGAQQGAEAGEIHSVGCDQRHSDEVVAALRLSHFPDSASDSDEMLSHCKTELQRYSPSAGRDPSVQLVLVTPGTNWKYMGDHTACCLAHLAADRVGSIKS